MRSVASILVTSLLALPLVIAACGDGKSDPVDDDPYMTLQLCFDDHTMNEGLPVQQAIVVCCIDHPINGVKPSCGDTEAACETHVRAELPDTTAVTAADVTAACMDYISKK